jgi:hypothetical protein
MEPHAAPALAPRRRPGREDRALAFHPPYLISHDVLWGMSIAV